MQEPSALFVLIIAAVLLACTRPLIPASVCEELATTVPELEHKCALLTLNNKGTSTELQKCLTEKVTFYNHIMQTQINKSEGWGPKTSK